MLLIILMAKKLLEHFTKNYCKKQIKKSSKKINGDKLYVKLKGYDNFFNCWIDKKGIIT